MKLLNNETNGFLYKLLRDYITQNKDLFYNTEGRNNIYIGQGDFQGYTVNHHGVMCYLIKQNDFKRISLHTTLN